MTASYRAYNCHHDGGYRAGMNDARSGRPMRAGFSHPCIPETQAEAERGYSEGYAAGISGRTVIVSQELLGEADPRADELRWHCEDAHGKRECGYRCVQAHGRIACAKQAHHNCVEAHGQLACGPNCRSERGKIVCDR